MTRLKLAPTISLDWTPMRRVVCKVIPLFDDDGDVLVYAEAGGFSERRGLSLKEIDRAIREVHVDDPEDFAKFMSRFGLVGRPTDRDTRTEGMMDVETVSDALETDKIYKFDRGINKRTGESDWTPEDRLAWYRAVQAAAEKEGLGWKGSDDALSTSPRDDMFVTAEEAKRAIGDIKEAGRVVMALMMYKEDREVATYLGVERDQLNDHIVSYLDHLNELLSGFHPEMNVVSVSDDGRERDLMLDEFHERTAFSKYREGTFDQTLALLIYKHSHGRYEPKICAECGKTFFKRDTKGRKTSPRSTAKFCSDRCKNRNMQRRKTARKGASSKASM